MPLQRQTLNINFAQGLDLKTDPFQVMPGKFLSLQNTIFSKGGLLQKRYGYPALNALADNSNSYLTTFNANLTAIGTSINVFSQGTNSWLNKGLIRPLELSVLPLVRSNTNQSQIDTAISNNGTICTVFTDNVPVGSSVAVQYKYVVSDATTGQNIVQPTQIVSSSFAVSFAPRVFALGNYYTVVFGATSSGGAARLQYIAINQQNPMLTSSVTNITTSYTATTQGSFDGVVANNSLYLSWNGAAQSGLKTAYITSTLVQSSTVTIASQSSSIVSVTADLTGNTPNIWTAGYLNGSNSGFIVATNQALVNLFGAVKFVDSSTPQVLNLAPIAQNGVMTLNYEVFNNYVVASATASHFLNTVTSTNTGSLSSTMTLARSVGLASKGFLLGSNSYFLAVYSSSYQPTYFLMNSSGQVVSKIAYTNAGGYYTTGLPSVAVSGTTARFAYLYKDLIQAVNKDTNVPTGTQVNGIYSQTGINLATINYTSAGLQTAEIGANLNINGGFLWMYDGAVPVEQNFFVYPDDVQATWNNLGGNMNAKPDSATNASAYYYQATYEWSDNQGNLFRSAPSLPVSVSTTGTSITGSVAVTVPMLRLTYKTANPVKIVLYRWSVAQESYYQTTSITSPILNSTSIEAVTITDTNSDATILGNNLIYTTGGVVENVNPPACNAMTLFQSRLWLIDAEDQNLLWFSKTVIEATPVEMSDLFTLFVPPTTGAQGSTGPMKALSSMDDKLIIFKKNAIYFISGNGPDNTGANNQFGDPVFITSTVGCDNQNSIVFTPQGLMFQSDKGIWMLGRDLTTSYIGAAVEDFNQYAVQSAVNVPGTNQVRFTLSNGVTLMYDYFFGQWGTFVNVPAISSTLYQGFHTYINSLGKVYQEQPGTYLDGSNPVLMSFKTSWLNLAGLQGFERAYFFYLLATYISPHKLSVQIAYDYNPSATQTTIISPDNFNGAYGSDTIYGGGTPYGGTSAKEQWRIFLERQKCQSFQLTFTEIFDASLGVTAGAGFTLSGIDLVVSAKGQYPRLGSSNGAG